MFPDFIGIGVQKSGTTWLDRNLRRHPQIWMPQRKELHYFDEKINNPSSLNVLPIRLFGKRSADSRWRKQVKNRTRVHLKKFDLQRFLWDFKYFMKPPGDEWYASLFEGGRGQITGEITPAYSVLDRDAISHVREIMPDVKIIFLMRNPIERAWSHAVMHFDKVEKGSAKFASEEELLREFSRKDSRRRTNYLRTLENWQSFYPEEQIFVGFSEDIHFYPNRLLRCLYEFLGAEVSVKYPVIRRKVHSRAGKTMPARMAIRLAHTYYDDFRKLDERFGGYASFWLYCAERLINDPPSEDSIPYPLWESSMWQGWMNDSGRSLARTVKLQSGPLSSIDTFAKSKDSR